ncbi:MAG: hypothetical protein IJ514_06130 [Clostridia bacterium]|nr:hypothetical protein [Clostridia bacterium]
MMKSKKKALTVLSLAFALSLATTGAVYSLTANAEPADAQKLSIDAGASVKIVGTEEDDYVDAETGIRFSATVAPQLVSSLGDNDYVGMMIVPSKVVTAYANQATDVVDGYLQYIASVKETTVEAVEADVSCRYATGDLSTEKDNTVYGVIATIKDEHYNEAYQAVAYYVQDGTYYYSDPSETRTISQVADEALRDTVVTYSNAEKNALGNIIEKAIVMKNGTDKATVTPIALKTWETRTDLKATYASEINATDLTITTDDGTVASVENDVLTGLQTAGETTLRITAYDGFVNLPIAVTSTAEKSGKTTGFHSAVEYATYGAKIGSISKDSLTSLNAMNNVQLGAGKLSDGATWTNVGATNMSYLSLNRKGDSYGLYDGTGYVSVIEFTGNNMPMVGYFVDDDADIENLVGQKGVLLTNGFDMAGDTNSVRPFQSSTRFYGYQMLKNDLSSSNLVTTDKTTDGVLASASSSIGQTYFEDETLADQRFRMFVTVKEKSRNDGYVSILEVSVYKIADNEYNGDVVFEYSAQRNYPAPDDFFTGNIVLYGRPNQTTVLDKVHLPINSQTSVANHITKYFTATA